MKLWNRLRTLSTQEKMMAAVVVMLLLMILTRWGSISRTAGEAFKQRFVPTEEQTDTLQDARSAGNTERADE